MEAPATNPSTFMGKPPGTTPPSCQNCYETGHWTYECRNPRVYLKRPTRTQILRNPALRPKFMEDENIPVIPRITDNDRYRDPVLAAQGETIDVKARELRLMGGPTSTLRMESEGELKRQKMYDNMPFTRVPQKGSARLDEPSGDDRKSSSASSSSESSSESGSDSDTSSTKRRKERRKEKKKEKKRRESRKKLANAPRPNLPWDLPGQSKPWDNDFSNVRLPTDGKPTAAELAKRNRKVEHPGPIKRNESGSNDFFKKLMEEEQRRYNVWPGKTEDKARDDENGATMEKEGDDVSTARARRRRRASSDSESSGRNKRGRADVRRRRVGRHGSKGRKEG